MKSSDTDEGSSNDGLVVIAVLLVMVVYVCRHVVYLSNLVIIMIHHLFPAQCLC